MRTRRSWKNQDRLFKELGREKGPSVCVWKENSDGAWETGCTNTFEVTAGTPASNNMKFCCYCGEKLKEEAHQCDAEITAQKEGYEQIHADIFQ
jgi:hypothetical protein